MNRDPLLDAFHVAAGMGERAKEIPRITLRVGRVVAFDSGANRAVIQVGDADLIATYDNLPSLDNGLTDGDVVYWLQNQSGQGVVLGRPGSSGGGGGGGDGSPGALLIANDLSDLGSPSAARGNLGLGALAVLSAITSSEITDGTILNADINAAAAIAYSKLALTGAILNADISASAAIAYSKLALASSIVSGDIVDGTIVNADLATAAAIAWSKMATTGTWSAPSGGRLVMGTEFASIPLYYMYANSTDAQPLMILFGNSLVSGPGGSTAPTAAFFIANFSVLNAGLAAMAANTMKVNATTGSATPTDLAFAASTVAGRRASGNIVAITYAQLLADLAVVLGHPTLSAQAANYTFVLGDARSPGVPGTITQATKATAQTLTIPPASSVAWVAESVIEFVVTGAGTSTLTAGAGVTLTGRTSYPTNSNGRAFRTAADTWFGC